MNSVRKEGRKKAVKSDRPLSVSWATLFHPAAAPSVPLAFYSWVSG